MKFHWSTNPKAAFLLAIYAWGLLFVSGLAAQTVTGSIYGTIVDSTGAALPNVSVSVTNVGTHEVLNGKSNGSGQYIFPVVNPGVYQASAVLSGFKTINASDVRVAANQNVNVSFTLTPGDVSTEVTVEAGTTLIDTRESQLGETIDQKRIVDLPLANRNAYDLVQLIPGVVNYTAGVQTGDNGGTQFSVNGIRPNFNSFYLDGAYNTAFFRGGGNLAPNPDALAQFRILTSNFDAEFGRYPGAVVNTITRSGTNQIHGVAYDYFRTNALNARNYFNSTVLPKYVYNVFGGGLGGPVIKDRLFAFLSYQGTRIRSSTIINPTSIVVPSNLERIGDFSQTTSVAKPALAVCPAYKCATDPVTQNILKYVPLADPTQTTFNAAGAPIYHPAAQVKPNP